MAATPPTSSPDMGALEARLGHVFRTRGLLDEALTHRSFAAESSDPTVRTNERLEFLGDAVMAFLTANLLYVRFADAHEGDLTFSRAALVRATTFASFARDLGVGSFLRLGRGEERTGGRDRENILADAFEAIIGAVYLDAGLESARAIAEPLLLGRLAAIEAEGIDASTRDAKSQLQLAVQGKLGQTPTYHTVGESGPAHAPLFVVEARLGDLVLGRGEGSSKREAQQAAARDALRDPGWSEAG